MLDGSQVPLGKGEPTKVAHVELYFIIFQSDLLYNEYIVYDVNQVQLKYLIQLKFNYK